MKSRCCACNGPSAVCRNCRCVKNKTACVSCYPSRDNRCVNYRFTSNSAPSIPHVQNGQTEVGSQILAPVDVSQSNASPQDTDSFDLLTRELSCLRRGSVVHRIPKGSRAQASTALSQLIESVCEPSCSIDEWRKLFLFSSCCLIKPKRGGKHKSSLSNIINRQIKNFQDNILQGPDLSIVNPRPVCNDNQDDFRAKTVGRKLANGDIKGAIRVLSSDDVLLAPDTTSFSALQSKHPAAHRDTDLPDAPDAECIRNSLQISEAQAKKAIMSFPAGSTGGFDLLTPQHLKDLISKPTGEAGVRLLQSITCLSNILLRGKLPQDVLPFFFGASLIAFTKPNGGIRPIAIGNVFRRLTAKAAASAVKGDIQGKLFRHQLGVGVPCGAEALVHSARSFCNAHSCSPDPILFLKIDFENAFNSIRRDKVLREIQSELKSLYPFLYQCYAKPSILFYNDLILHSSEGIQQGDPLGPLCFSLAINRLINTFSSMFNAWYLDDGSLAGDPQSVLSDFKKIVSEQSSLGLKVNVKKCEFFVLGSNEESKNSLTQFIFSEYPDVKHVSPSVVSLLGAPIFEDGIENALTLKLSILKKTCSRLTLLERHDALFLLRNVFFLPKLLYLLRSSPCFHSHILKDIDATIHACLENITNCVLGPLTFEQATLPVRLGGLGVRQSVDLSLPAYISSTVKAANQVKLLIPIYSYNLFRDTFLEAINIWKSKDSQLIAPKDQASLQQRAWDEPVARLKLSHLLNAAQSLPDRARLLAVSSPSAGTWLNAVPIRSLGLKLEDEELRIAVALRLGIKVSLPYSCECGVRVAENATHGLDCRRSSGKHIRHASANDVIIRALQASGIPSQKEPQGLSRDDGKRPDGATLIPWQQGRCTVWDFTCVNTLAPSYLKATSSEPGAAAKIAEEKKKKKYTSLSPGLSFTPIAVETLGAWGVEGARFIADIARRLMDTTGDPRAASFLWQRLGIAIQRGNATCLKLCLPAGLDFNELFYI